MNKTEKRMVELAGVSVIEGLKEDQNIEVNLDENGFTQEEVNIVLQAAAGQSSRPMDVQELMDYLDS